MEWKLKNRNCWKDFMIILRENYSCISYKRLNTKFLITNGSKCGFLLRGFLVFLNISSSLT